MSTATLTCPACGVDTQVETIPEWDEEVTEDEKFLLSSHGEDILGISFEELRALVKDHVRTPMSIPVLGAVLRMRDMGKRPDAISLRIALIHAHQAGVIFLYKAWSWSGYAREPWVRDLVVFPDPPTALLSQNLEEL